MSEQVEESLLSASNDGCASRNQTVLDECTIGATSADLSYAVGTLGDFCTSLAVPAELEALFVEPSPQTATAPDIDDRQELESRPLRVQGSRPQPDQIAPGVRVGRFKDHS